jgi:hypothetical protein
MGFITAILDFFARLFGLKKEPEDNYTNKVHPVGTPVYYFDLEENKTKTGVVAELVMDLDPESPHSVKFDGEDEITGTFSYSELTEID